MRGAARSRYGGWAAALRRRSEKGLRSATYRQWGRRCFRSLGGAARHSGQPLLGVLDLGVGTRGSRIGATPMHFRARARRRGGGRLASRSSSSWSSLPWMREMSLLLCLSGSRRSERRSANIVDAALVEECVETWEGGAATRGQEGNVSSPLRGHHPSVASYAFCPFACVLMSGTLAFLRHHDNLFGSRK